MTSNANSSLACLIPFLHKFFISFISILVKKASDLSTSSSYELIHDWKNSNGVVLFLDTHKVPDAVLPIFSPSAFNKRGHTIPNNGSIFFPSLNPIFLDKLEPAKIFPHWSDPPICNLHPNSLFKWTKSKACISIYPISKKVKPPLSNLFL